MIETRETMAAKLLAALDCIPYTIADVPLAYMPVLISDGRRVRDRYEADLRALGWSTADIYGADPRAPWARLDRQGLVWSLRDGVIREIGDEAVVIERAPNGARLTFRRPSINAT